MGNSSYSDWTGFLQALIALIRSCLLTIYRVIAPAIKGKIPSIKSSILLTSATDLADKIRTKELTSSQVVKCFIERVKETNPIVNGIVEDNFEEALSEARRVDRYIETSGKSYEELANEQPLLGVPITVKSNLACKGRLFESGLVSRKGIRADDDAVAVGYLKKAGAIVIGMTNVPELSTSFHACNKIYGPSRNPHDLSKTPGGSSGGESAMISVGASVLGLGNDLCGSLRMPSSLTGIFAHKPSSGIISNKGMFPPPVEGKTVDKVLVQGPLARYVKDLETAMKILVNPTRNLKFGQPIDLTKIKVLYCDDDAEHVMADPISTDSRSAIQNVLSHLQRKYGVTARKISIPNRNMIPWIMGAKNKDEGGVVYKSLLTKDPKKDINLYFELVNCFFGWSNHTFDSVKFGILDDFSTVDGPVLERYKSIENEIRSFYESLVDENTVIICPSWPKHLPYPLENSFQDFNMIYYTIFGLIGAPVTNCPVGTDSDGCPIGIQVAGAPLGDALTIAVAKEIEKEFGGWVKPCPVIL